MIGHHCREVTGAGAETGSHITPGQAQREMNTYTFVACLCLPHFLRSVMVQDSPAWGMNVATHDGLVLPMSMGITVIIPYRQTHSLSLFRQFLTETLFSSDSRLGQADI